MGLSDRRPWLPTVLAGTATGRLGLHAHAHALALWPLVTGAPAFVVALLAAAGLARLRGRG
jgi:hypothetical protein